jgi:hypothetical protein
MSMLQTITSHVCLRVPKMTPRIAYFAHDLAGPAIHPSGANAVGNARDLSKLT